VQELVEGAGKMTMTYDEMTKWIEEYFHTYSVSCQPDTYRRLDKYYSRNIVFNPFVATIDKVAGRDEWYKALLSHPSSIEQLTPEEVVIDERKQTFAAQIKAELIDRHTNELLLTKRYLARYPLVEEDGQPKISRINFFFEVMPSGTVEIEDVFDRDRRQQRNDT
jgi:hypothetical protein